MGQPKKPVLIDSHVHTDDPRLADTLPQVLQAARSANIVAQVVPSVREGLWTRVRELCSGHYDLYACYGLHPCFCEHHTETDIEELALWIGRERPVGVGECGLDYRQGQADKRIQQRLFAAQLALAREFRLPVVIHAVRAVEDVIRMIRSSGHDSGMLHSFNGSLQQAQRLIDLGFKLSFGGAVSYDSAHRIRAVLEQLPLESLLLETDAPDQPAAAYRGQRNEPAYLADILNSVSEIRGEAQETIARVTSANAIELFSLPLQLDDSGDLMC